MSMPKGHKMQNGYFTVSSVGGMGFRQIAEEMTQSGDKMNQATARNVFLRALRKIAEPMVAYHEDCNRSAEDVAKDPRFQQAILDMMKGR